MSAFAEPTFAWEPITPRGVAAFARASFGRLFLVQAIVAALAMVAVFWFLAKGIFPVVDDTVDALPDQGQIQHDKLSWGGDSPALLGENATLAIIVDLDHGGDVRSPADFQFEFGTNSVQVLSLFGTAELDYLDIAPNAYIPMNRPVLKPRWDAWRPDLLVLAAVGTFFGLLITWFVLATLYCLPVWLICFFSNRDVGLLASWRLAGAALMPGAILLSLSLVAYELGVCDLVQMIFVFGLHLVVGWIYLFVAPMFLNLVTAKPKANPFNTAPSGG